MKFAVTHPLALSESDPAFVSGSGVRRFAEAAEGAGFDGIGFTDHPAPTHKWRTHGGHDAFDPLTALAYCAAVTDDLRLITNIIVLPYRNPFLTAKAAATVDVLSDGRLTLAAGVGYLRGEFAALGVDPDERNELFDEAIEVMRTIWNADEVTHQGRHFTAPGQTAHPAPLQRPGPPIWIGGNSRRARERAARTGDGWAPFPAPADLARTARTAPLSGPEDLAERLDHLWAEVEAAGRIPHDLDIAFTCTAGGAPADADFDVDTHLEGIDVLAGLGVTWVWVGVPGDDLHHAIDVLRAYGENVISAYDASRTPSPARRRR